LSEQSFAALLTTRGKLIQSVQMREHPNRRKEER
jgi:hypothetical protein